MKPAERLNLFGAIQLSSSAHPFSLQCFFLQFLHRFWQLIRLNSHPGSGLSPLVNSVGSVQTILVGMFMQGLFTVPESLSV